MANICKESPLCLVGLVRPLLCLRDAFGKNAYVKWKDHKGYQNTDAYRYVRRPERRCIEDYQEANDRECL